MLISELWKKTTAPVPSSVPIVPAPILIDNTKSFTTRVEFFENSLDSLNKKISFYLLKKSEVGAELKGKLLFSSYQLYNSYLFLNSRTNEGIEESWHYRKQYRTSEAILSLGR